jgi:ubiquitin carboxyl-terminal hydrolase 16/45
MDDFVSFPEKLDMTPFLAPNRNDYKISQTPSGPRAPYMDWHSVEHGPEAAPVWYRLYGMLSPFGEKLY